MKTPIRFQSQLLIRRSYKPERTRPRRIRIEFPPSEPVEVLISVDRSDDRSARTVPPAEMTLSG